jgi:hypothetical protein
MPDSAGREGFDVLEMRSVCERCGGELPPVSGDAFICSFECTFCRGCAEGELGLVCPNCSGVLVVRPSRIE